MMHRVDQKILLDIINPWPRVGSNIPVRLWGKNSCRCEENWYTRPLKLPQFCIIHLVPFNLYSTSCVHVLGLSSSLHI